ncbi:MAG: hypothetical protein KGL35_06495 [Bradyrhizobium sp.]|nr:hypothetical protein [Bradyrhizobium sp.]
MASTDVLTLDEALQIRAMRQMLRNVGQRVWNTAHEQERNAFWLGKMHQTIVTAEEFLFDVLNTASSACDSQNAADALAMGR